MENNRTALGENPNLAGSVLLERMPQQAEVRSAEDDWTGSTSAADRRKRQNRLHQRMWRKRQKELKNKDSSSPESTKESTPPTAGTYDPHLNALMSSSNAGMSFEMPTRVRLEDYEYKQRLLDPNMTRPQVQDVIEQVETFVALQRRMTSVPRADLLLTLVQFNVFRALHSNMVALDFTLDWLTGDAISPFFQTVSPIHDLTSPSSLRSTALQRQVSHHPYLDLFPFPVFRDNMLLQGEDYDDNDLCYDLVEICHAPRERSGMIVWSSPWEPSSWEVTPEFASKFPWMLKGCRELLISTNYWRRKRGEEDLVFDITPVENRVIEI